MDLNRYAAILDLDAQSPWREPLAYTPYVYTVLARLKLAIQEQTHLTVEDEYWLLD